VTRPELAVQHHFTPLFSRIYRKPGLCRRFTGSLLDCPLFGHVRRNQYFITSKGRWGNRDRECADNYLNVNAKVSQERSFGPRAVIALGGVDCSWRLHMAAAVAIFVALFVAIFLLFLPFFMSGKQWRAAHDRARARRMAEHRMNARLLRLNI
jgi:hypothetical protein